MGGLGTGSIGRTFRGDVSRWHLDVGRHRFEPVAADGFAVFVGRPDGSTRATVLSAYRPPDDVLPDWGWDLPIGAGTYHALFPRAWQTFEPADADLGIRLVSEQLSPVIAGDLERSALPVGVFEWWCENPGPDPLTVGLLFTWADPPGGPTSGPAPAREHDIVGDPTSGRVAIRFGDTGPAGPTALRGTLAIAALADAGWSLSARAEFDPLRRPGPVDRLRRRRPSRPAVRGPADPSRSPGGRVGRRCDRRDDRAGTGRAALRPVRAGVGPADGRVRGRAALVEALHARLGPHRPVRGRARPPRPGRDARLARRHRGLAAAGPRRSRSGPPGIGRRCSTSCTSSSTAGRSGRPARSARPSRRGTMPATSRSSSASTTRSTTRSTSTSTPRSPCSSCSRSWSSAGSATCSPPSRTTTPRS